MRYKIILNPVSGKGLGGQMQPEIEKQLTGLGIDYHIVRTDRPRHAEELAEEAVRDGFDVIVAAGGDGTVNEVINGLMRIKQREDKHAILGVLCVGRGNDFAFGMDISTKFEACCMALGRKQLKTIDIGRVRVDDAEDWRYFGNGIGVGFDAVVGFEAARMKRVRGFMSYLIAALKTLFLYYTPPLVRMRYKDTDDTRPSLMVSIMNGRRMGGGFIMAPMAVADDGLLDLCIAGVAGKMRILGLMLQFMKGTQEGHSCIRFEKTNHLVLNSMEGVLPAHADGETLCMEGEKIEVELLPKQLQVIY